MKAKEDLLLCVLVLEIKKGNKLFACIWKGKHLKRIRGAFFIL